MGEETSTYEICAVLLAVPIVLYLFGVLGFTIYALSVEGPDVDDGSNAPFLNQIYAFCIYFPVLSLLSCFGECIKVPKGASDNAKITHAGN